MQTGSLVKCVSHINNFVSVIFEPPKCGQIYEVESVERCRCNRHDNLILVGVDGSWHIKHFKEVQPPVDMDEVMKNLEPDTCHIEELEFEEV